MRFRITPRSVALVSATMVLFLSSCALAGSPKWVRKGGIDCTAATCANVYSAVGLSPEVVGKISATGASETGLKVGTPVIAGAGDQAAGAVGMGIVAPGAVSATIGTSGVVFAATDRPAAGVGAARSWPAATDSRAEPVPARHLSRGPNSVCGRRPR